MTRVRKEESKEREDREREGESERKRPPPVTPRMDNAHRRYHIDNSFFHCPCGHCPCTWTMEGCATCMLAVEMYLDNDIKTEKWHSPKVIYDEWCGNPVGCE